MPKSVFAPTNEQYYEFYRRSLIERHIASNGRFLGAIWLVEKSNTAQDGSGPSPWDTAARDSVEQYEDSTQDYGYVAYPALVSTSKTTDGYLLPGGSDNPLLYGGLAMATLCMEDLKGVSPHSFVYAKKLLDFFLLSEWEDDSGNRSGFLRRRRHFWHHLKQASTDELCGVLLGLHFYIKSATQRGDAQEEGRATDLLRRIAVHLKSNSYIYKPPPDCDVRFEAAKATAWIFQFPFTRIFKEHLGSSYRSDEVIPEGWQGETGDLLYVLLSTINLDANYTPKDLFRDVLLKFPAAYTLTSGKNFFNLTMTAYAILMVLLPDVVDYDVKSDIADAGERFFFDLGRYPETDAYDNAFFGVVAKLCRQLKDGSDPGGSKITSIPGVSHVAKLLGAIRSGICRGAMWLENTCREYTLPLKGRCVEGYEDDVLECTEEKDEGYEKCNEWKDEGYNECSDWDDECCTWIPCSWACKVVTWVCVGWRWVSNLVCKAWVWVEQLVCVAWEWIKKWVCLAWAWLVSAACALVTWPVKNMACRRDNAWAERIEECIDVLVNPSGRWFHDLPLGEPKDADEAPFDIVAPFKHRSADGPLLLGGHIFTWVHSDDLGHTFTYAFTWDATKATGEIGPAYDSEETPRWICDESLEHLYESEAYYVDPSRGFRLESAGLGLLFPRMLLAYLDMTQVPTLSAEGNQQFGVLPVPGPSPDSEDMCAD